jgi:catalase
MRSTIVATGCALALALTAPVQAEEADAAAIVGAQFAAGGNKPGVRASGA